ncbi:LysR family transcriptional regulator [Caulobacter sp. S45]|uniref:LysR family transcriptional regulator n=1 Tax=Caulobacter sp. S45 TaxID=1641861 RepID=UPI00131CAAA1|nr:LysR family transcriptional regulator [Caulobacter sp. S45]
MELRHLRYFVAVAEAGGVSRAAARLGIQQPPLGQQIRALEQELGLDLFDRAPKRIVLNAAGDVFLEDARRILSEVDTMVEHVRRFARGEQGRVAVGFTSSASLHRLTPKLIRAFRQAYPQAEIDVEERETFELILGLQQRRIDAAFLHISAQGFPDLQDHVLDQEGLVAAIPAEHPLAASPGEPLPLAALSGQRMVVYRRTDGPGIFEGVSAGLAAAGVVPIVVDEVQRLVAALNLVAAGRGVSLVPASMQVLHPDAIVYRPLADGALPPLPLYLIHRKEIDLTLVRNFIDVAVSFNLA